MVIALKYQLGCKIIKAAFASEELKNIDIQDSNQKESIKKPQNIGQLQSFISQPTFSRREDQTKGSQICDTPSSTSHFSCLWCLLNPGT